MGLTFLPNDQLAITQRIHVLWVFQRRSIAATLGLSALIAGILLSLHRVNPLELFLSHGGLLLMMEVVGRRRYA
jgi:hypothetical protein